MTCIRQRRREVAAVEDYVIRTNPAAGLGRSLRLRPSPAERRERIRALDRGQLARLLAAAEAKAPKLLPAVLRRLADGSPHRCRRGRNGSSRGRPQGGRVRIRRG